MEPATPPPHSRGSERVLRRDNFSRRLRHRVAVAGRNDAADSGKRCKESALRYWYKQPDVASVDCGNFDSLWNTAFDVARDDHFMIDRTDFRSGLLTTQPMISKQPFEVWRDDVVDTHSMLQSAWGRCGGRFNFTSAAARRRISLRAQSSRGAGVVGRTSDHIGHRISRYFFRHPSAQRARY